MLDSLESYRVRTSNGYVHVKARAGKKLSEKDLDSKATAEALKPLCTVCGLGACFMSLVAIDNKLDFVKVFEDVNPDYFGPGALRPLTTI